ncbi:ImmA/IrrE family metallo-endopeptidase [Fundicoccus culcitae]|uniref:IrrE N-terminal-like domain-containing protein n=1 Tax=Fundicoccus culcitae TaxID=2969821 RepID=A0ABY5P439_9LACT|nr:ImmA/IrrE family metallo-endopeptidase [Fundicoccus culcitae]UUX33370.1 hypothetical protein NRE15_10720 [Fundicoccus culcitae]
MMKITNNQVAEIADIYASVFLKKYFGEEVFLGSVIERVLSKKAHIIYQNVDDPSYYGATVHMLDKQIIAINTAQPLRIRYYSAAHELWYLLYDADELPIKYDGFEHERVAEQFATRVMLPDGLVRTLLRMIDGTIENKVIEIADLSSMPYVIVTNRLKELGARVSATLMEREEEDWIKVRKLLGYPPSVLDKSDAFKQFWALSKEVEQQLETKEITLEIAANLIKHIDPEQAEKYWKQRQDLLDDWSTEDD